MTEAQIKDSSSLVDKVVLFTMSFGSMGNTRKAPREMLSTDADTALFKVNKTLLDSPELKDITRADAALRTYIYSLCHPLDCGIMVLERSLVDKVQKTLQEYSEYRKSLVEKFIAVYPLRVEETAKRLGSQANLHDYLSVDEVASKFTFDWQYLSFRVPDELKHTETYKAEQAKIVEKVNAVTDEITMVMRQNLLELVTHLKTALEPSEDGKTKRLHNTAITHVQEFLESFASRNITNDAELEKLVNDAKLLLHSGVDADTIKQDENFKATIHSGMETIANELTKLVEVVPSRKFRKRA